jgi:glycosyltransferase involved in cell wall biosynthesis/peptidoglycan/xylan/chitin deacetylase (PgdA/CDA1 family)
MRESANPITLSVVIPTFNRRQVLERTLRSLMVQDFPPEYYEIIVVVDGSTDGTAQMLRDWKPACSLRVMESSHRGPGAARNIGFRAAVGDLVLFLDDDLMCTPGLLRQHCSSHLGSEPLVIHGPIYVSPESSKTIIRYITERGYERYYRPLDSDMELRFPDKITSFSAISSMLNSSMNVLSSMANSSISRETLLASGGFDERLLAAEDLELGLRLWKIGTRFRFQPAAIAHEFFVKSSPEFLQGQAQAIAAGDLYISRKHPEYRRFTALSGLAETRWLKRWLRKAIVRAPVSAVPLMTAPLRFEKQLYRFAPMRKAGVRLLNYATVITQQRVARKAAGSWEALQSEFGRKLPVFLYHHVGPPRPGTISDLTISPKEFERQVRWLSRRGFVGIRPCDWRRWLRDGTGLPDKPILFTFDDGYADIADYALPVLRRYGFSAAVYIVTGQLGGTNAWDEVQGSGSHRLMTVEQIRDWAAKGIEFGAHSRTHPDLRTLSISELAAEISGSKNDLASVLGAPVVSFAYPYGELSEAVSEAVRAEFDLAFTVERGLNYLRTDPHLLRRINISPNDSLIDIECHTHWAELQHLSQLRARLKVRSRLKRAARFALRGQ